MSSRIRLFQALTFLLIILALAIASVAQRTPQLSSDDPTQNQTQSQDNQAADDSSAETLKVKVDVVQLFFNVKTKKGGLVPSLTKDDFSLAEDGKPQTIKYFTAESNLPLTLGILIDSSGSQQRVIDMEKVVGANFLEQILRPKDEAFVISFDVDVNLLQDFTTSTRRLRDALNSATINAPPSSCGSLPGSGGGPLPCSLTPQGTLLYDAVYLAAHDELSKEAGRKAMILLTDGDDQGSKLKLKDAIEAAQKSDSIVYVLLIADRGFYGFGGYTGEGEMKKMAEQTGGRVIDVGNKPDKLKDAFEQISNELRSQYSIGYTPTNRAKDGTFRKIGVATKNKDYKIQSRSGYYAIEREE